MAAAPAEACWVTEVSVNNIHCASCISHIKEVFAHFGSAVSNISISIRSLTVQVWHQKSFSIREICDALTDAAFDVVSAITHDELQRLVDNTDSKTDNAYRSRPASSMLDRKTRHTQYCATCRMEELQESGQGAMELGSIKPREERCGVEECLDGAAEALHQRIQDPTENNSQTIERTSTIVDESGPQYVVTLMIEGMTCGSCSSAITTLLEEKEYVSEVNVSLLTNSAVVKYTGTVEKARDVVKVVEDAGFDAWQTKLEPFNSTTAEDTRICDKSVPRRSIMLRISGMFCDHCPSKVVETLNTKFAGQLEIEDWPSLKSPIIRLKYSPIPGLLTLREIVSTIDEAHERFVSHVYRPPSIEDQAQSMQAQERKGLLKRLILCVAISIPTFLIGVVWMDLVSRHNPARTFLEQPMSRVPVTRAQLALFILASSVMFLAADVFHQKAIREIWGLWRPQSQVPILRRFYRFGSMNLLVSAGTSVAYISSLAVLIKGTAAKSGVPSHSPQYFDAVVFLTLFILLGKFLSAYSKAKTGSAVTMLSKLCPQEAILVNPPVSSDDHSESTRQSLTLKDDDVSTSCTQPISTDLLDIGDVVLVPCGSSPPADGIIINGSSAFNESSLTGESRGVLKSEGDQVFAGTVNTGNPVQVEITGLGGTSMLDRIISVVREGQTKRAPVERIVDTVTAYFVPVITALAIITFLVWFALGTSGLLDKKYLGNKDGGWAFWSLEFAISVFIVACPCGIGLAAPTALFVGGGLAAKSGILVRGGGEAFQEASVVDAVVFDKTGTLTEGGNPTVTDYQMLVEGEESKIAWCATRGLEETSSHPLARAILNLASMQAGVELITDAVSEEAGRGLRGTFSLKQNEAESNPDCAYEAAIGSEAFLTALQGDILNYYHTSTLSTWKSQSKSIALLGLRKVSGPPTDTASSSSPWILAALFAISDPLRPSAIPTINALQASGIAVYMLTGDNPTTASAVASTLAIPADHVFAACLPTEKADKVEWLKGNAPLRTSISQGLFSRIPSLSKRCRTENVKKRKAVIAFVGDGINDAPALTVANVSIAISSSTNTSSDIALSSSSFILLSSSLTTILTLLNLSRLVFRRIKFNFLWAVGYNALLVPMAAGFFFPVTEKGWRLSPVWGSAAMALSSISVVVASLAMGWGWKRRVKGWEKRGGLGG
ncbi:MAG: hypothetical protein Q9182_002610 [Xanthomendoza sp. 2 TL-2023]